MMFLFPTASLLLFVPPLFLISHKAATRCPCRLLSSTFPPAVKSRLAAFRFAPTHFFCYVRDFRLHCMTLHGLRRFPASSQPLRFAEEPWTPVGPYRAACYVSLKEGARSSRYMQAPPFDFRSFFCRSLVRSPFSLVCEKLRLLSIRPCRRISFRD